MIISEKQLGELALLWANSNSFRSVVEIHEAMVMAAIADTCDVTCENHWIHNCEPS